VETWFLVSEEGTALGIVVWKVFPCMRGGQCARSIGVENWFLVFAEGNALGAVVWKRGSFYPRGVIRTVEWRGNVFSCICGRQCVRWSVVVTWYLQFAEDNAIGGMTWKRFSLYPRKTMRSVEGRVNVVPFIPGRQCVACGGVETCFLVPSEGNEFGEMAWIRGSLYPLRAMRSVVWRGNVFPFLRGAQYDRLNGMESWFLFYAEGNALGGVVWKRVPFYPRRAIRSVEWRGNVFQCTLGRQ